MVCVRFGMVTAETDVEELLGLVESVGKEVEESSRYLESLTEIVKKGRQHRMSVLLRSTHFNFLCKLSAVSIYNIFNVHSLRYYEKRCELVFPPASFSKNVLIYYSFFFIRITVYKL